jgi:hypothetical protein
MVSFVPSTMITLKRATILSWFVLLAALGSFACAAKFPDKVPMSALVLMAAIGLGFANALMLMVVLAITATTPDAWRVWAVSTLVVEVLASTALAGLFVYAFFHLPVH